MMESKTEPGAEPDALAALLRDPQRAAQAAQRALTDNPASRAALQLLAAAMRRLGRPAIAERAEVEALRLSLEEPLIEAASAALKEGRVGEAEQDIGRHLARHPNDAAALRLLADVAARAGRPDDAERLLRRALELAPAFASARQELAMLLHKQNRPAEAVTVIDERLAEFPDSADLLHLKSMLLSRGGRTEEAIAATLRSLERRDTSAVSWLSHGRLLASVGRKAEAVAALRRAAGIDPTFGAAWWSIADIDAGALGEDDVSAMRRALQTDAAPAQLLPIHFALGRWFERRGAAEASFEHFAKGHALRRQAMPYDAAAITRFVAESSDRLTGSFFARKGRSGEEREDRPIFIVGMHRAGSTLVEQILASHPQVEGLAELPHLAQIARGQGFRDAGDPTRYLDALTAMTGEQSRALAAEYGRGVAGFRQSGRHHCVDKMPGNWRFVPLIQLLMPNARIIDVRREPFDCCVSNYCRYFANGQQQADDLRDLGRYYRDYAAFMDHVDMVLPGRVLRLSYERLVEDTEGQVRRLLDACGLSFDPRCLRFFEAERAVRTPSAQQVRRPINRDGIGRWRQFAPWLAPLAEGLNISLPA